MPTVPTARSSRQEHLPRQERALLSLGLGLALFFALGLGLIVFFVNRSGITPAADSGPLVIAPDYPRHLIDFSLTDQAGKSVTRRDLDGHVVVVSFLFTSCSVVCAYVSSQMSKIQRLTAGQDVRLISLTLDPADDTVPVLAQYGQGFGLDARRWSLLTGDENALRHFIGTSFLAPDTTGQFATMPGNFANSQRIVLVDPQGNIVKYFDGLNQNAADAVIAEIRKLGPSS
jgi:protein SCO1/2